MLNDKRLNVVLCWHMHQPQYRDLHTGAYVQPWTYLHAIKDYTDMAAHLERHPAARAVVNFVPMMLEEILNYQKQIGAFLQDQEQIDDPLLSALGTGCSSLPRDICAMLARQCLRANGPRMIQRFDPFRDLVDILKLHSAHDISLSYLQPSFYDDLIVWYHLAWMGETIRRQDARVQQLMNKAHGYTIDDRLLLLNIVGEALAGLIPRYRALSSRGQVELSMTPYAHPMLPLLLDFHSASDAMPDVPLPDDVYPGGEQRVRWHIEAGLQCFENVFGERPIGCWPAEGGISEEVLPLLAEHGFQWFASGQAVLRNSLRKYDVDMAGTDWPYRVYAMDRSSLCGFFRDDALSDAIGFNYFDWHGEDAVADLVARLENIASHAAGAPGGVVSIIMDGENAWEQYPENGFYFLDHLYEALSNHPRIELTTYRDLMTAGNGDATPLPGICAGSWVYGTFSTWIGDADKNRAWRILVECKRVFDEVVSDSSLSAAQIQLLEKQLAVCEGSDWFWWFGDYNPAEAIEDFSELFRLHIRNLYALLQRPVSEGLDASFGRGGGAGHGGVMRRGNL